MWVRLLNPDAVDVEVLHVDEGRHLLRVSRGEDRIIPDVGAVWHTITDEVELVPTPLGKVPAATIHICPAGVFVHTDRAPAVGNWRGATTDEVLRAISEGAG